MHKCKKHPCPEPATCKCRKIRDAKVPIIWIMGPPGSGKSVICTMFMEKFGFNNFSIGDILREEIQSGTKQGKEIEEIMARGELVANDVVVNLLERKMMKVVKQSKGYLVDGYPMEKDQASLFEKFIAPVDLIIVLECSDEILIERILHRAEEDGANARPEDNEAVASSRIYKYREVKDDLIKEFLEKIKIINTEKSIDNVLNELLPIIETTIATKFANTPDPTCD